MAKHRLKLTSLIFLSIFSFSLTGAGAQTACFNVPLAGVWINSQAAVKDLVKLDIVHQCTQEETEEGLIIPGARWYVRAWAKCYPRNCAWGLTRARIGPEGNLRASLPTWAADRFVQIKMQGDAISVDLIVDYHDERRKDRDENLRFNRQGD